MHPNLGDCQYLTGLWLSSWFHRPQQ